MDGIINLKPGTTLTVLLVVVVNVIALLLLEVPLITFAVAPDWTPTAIERANAWFADHRRGIAVIGTALVRAAAGHQDGDQHDRDDPEEGVIELLS